MKKKILAIIFLFISIFFFCVSPFEAFALTQEEVVDQFIEISSLISSIQEQVEQLLIELQELLPSSSFLTLGDFLKELFEENEIFLTKEEFLGEVEYPYLALAKILNLIPDSYQYDKKITQIEGEQISSKFALLKDKIRLDGLYGKIDLHEHYWYGGNMEEFLKAAGSLGISKIVFLPTGLSPNNQGYKINQKVLVEYYKEKYPEKIVPLCSIDESDSLAAIIFEECLKAGGEGLKLIGGHPKFYDEPLNSENMYKVYQVASDYQVPVLIHASIINLPELKEQLDQIFTDFPDVTFIHAHYCSTIMKGINLDQCAELLDDHPNVYFDLSMGGGIKRYHKYFREDLNKVKDFILTYQDRVFFGSDIILNSVSYKDFNWLYDRLSCDINLHQEEEYTCAFGEKDLTHQGFNFKKEVLQKLYFENPKKILGF
jgi:predicted TIM-barrel fold metal-dependent hydrolase